MVLELSPEEFTYIGRPWETFLGRWQAIEKALQDWPSDKEFSCIDVGSNNGYFSLQAAHRWPKSFVVGLEGAVGVGNGNAGLSRNTQVIVETSAVRTHLKWLRRLKMENCVIAPEVWDYEMIREMTKQPLCDLMISLSVVHHIDTVSEKQYQAKGMEHVDGTIDLLGQIFKLARTHILELPDNPWLSHMWKVFPSPKAAILAACERAGLQPTTMEVVFRNEWYGSREVWHIRFGDLVPVPPAALRQRFSAPFLTCNSPLPLEDLTEVCEGVKGRTGEPESFTDEDRRLRQELLDAARIHGQ